MHDKQVRRRRAVLGLLVAVSLISLTAYFGETPNSPLHGVQRGIVEVLSPVQRGASIVFSPVRDVAGWVSDTIHAKSEVHTLRAEVRSLTQKYADAETALVQNQQLTQLVHLDDSIGINGYHPVTGSVIEKDPLLWYQTLEIDKGSDDGVALNDPVLGDGGLVGKISLVGSNISYVTLITDHTMAVAAQVLDSSGDSGMLVPDLGNPQSMLLQYLPRTAPVQVGQLVVTAGFKDGPLEDLYPAGIPIGTVSDASSTDLLGNGEVHVALDADLRHLSVVQVLTSPHGGQDRASLDAQTG